MIQLFFGDKTLFTEELYFMSTDIVGKYVLTHMIFCLQMCYKAEVWQEWRNKMTKNPCLKACVFIDKV